jgi:hypothetical protein
MATPSDAYRILTLHFGPSIPPLSRGFRLPIPHLSEPVPRSDSVFSVTPEQRDKAVVGKGRDEAALRIHNFMGKGNRWRKRLTASMEAAVSAGDGRLQTVSKPVILNL